MKKCILKFKGFIILHDFRDYIVTNAPTDLRSISYPGGAAALSLLLTARIISAIWNHISDCDETYNYWEPLHYLGMFISIN